MLVRQRIIEERKRNGLSTADLADLLNINKGTINRWENGYTKSIPPETVRQLADIFHLSLDEFIDDDPDYAYLLSEKKRHSSTSVQLSDEENAMVIWYRNLSSKEKKLIRKLWQTA